MTDDFHVVDEDDTMREWVHNEVDKLPTRERVVLHLLYMEGFDQKSVGDAIGKDSRSVRRIRDKALERLREKISA